MLEIVIIGSGNVAQHLIRAFTASGKVRVIQVFARQAERLSGLVKPADMTSDFSKLKEAPLYLIAVSDNAIAAVSSQIPFSGKIVAHTSGSMPLTILDPKNNRASFYPLQTFSAQRPVDFDKIPICLETENPKDMPLLEKLARSIAAKTYPIDSGQRKALHVAAVFACNFVNHLYRIGEEICSQHQLPFEMLHPLIKETAAKIQTLSPALAQTGPAHRHDTQTINAHLQLLTDENQIQLYKILTQSIIDHG